MDFSPLMQPPRFSLHGYQPILVDDVSLVPDLHRESLLDELSRKIPKLIEWSWRQLLTTEELRDLQRALDAVPDEARAAGYRTANNRFAQERRLALLHGARDVAEVRRRLNRGRRVWYDDRPPHEPDKLSD